MKNGYLFETEEIDSNTFDELDDDFEDQKIDYCYFLANQKHYLIFWRKDFIETSFIDSLSKRIRLLNKLDSREREIRSMRGLILYALEIIETAKEKEFKIVGTNLKPFFWKNVKRVIKQNKKKGLQDFLFGKEKFHSTISLDKNKEIEIELEINLLKNKIQILETKNIEFENELLGKLKERNLDFSNLKNISDDQQTEIIKTGFQMHANKKISLKDYYEGNQKESLLQLKGYRIKYETIRRTKKYKQLNQSKSNQSNQI